MSGSGTERSQDDRRVSGDRSSAPTRMPAAIRWPVTLFFVVWLPTWWIRLGPANFLWFSDLALIAATLALWWPNRLLASTAAVAVLLPELVWTLDFLIQLVTPFDPFGLASYMFRDELTLPVRIMSGAFHLVLPPLLLYLVWRLGYDRRALAVQTTIAWVVLPLSRWLGTPEANLNWTYGLGEGAPIDWPPLLYLAVLMLGFPLLVYWPTDRMLRRLPPPGATGGRDTQDPTPAP